MGNNNYEVSHNHAERFSSIDNKVLSNFNCFIIKVPKLWFEWLWYITSPGKSARARWLIFCTFSLHSKKRIWVVYKEYFDCLTAIFGWWCMIVSIILLFWSFKLILFSHLGFYWFCPLFLIFIISVIINQNHLFLALGYQVWVLICI